MSFDGMIPGNKSKKFLERKERIRQLDRALKKLFPDARIELDFSNPWELLVAVQLSAQSTDKGVNKITKKLFKKYKKLDDYVKADIREFERDIFSSGFYRAKAKHILGAAKMIKSRFGGTVPDTLEGLLGLPGVGRKTANVFLSEIHGAHEGLAVDTHVIRFARRFNLSDHKDPARIEKDLMRLLPKKEWGTFTHRAIHYGRRLAPARPYDTAKDPLIKIYPKAAKIFRV